MSNLIHKYIETTTKALDDERALIVTISTDTPDRYGDVMVPKGAKLDSYRKNPVVLFGHDGNALPIAKAIDLIVGESDIKAKVQFPEAGTYAMADTVYALAKQGFMNAWSIGFIPDFTTAERIPSGGHKFLDWELLEFSAVPIPANPEALTIVRSFGLKDDEVKQLVEEGETPGDETPEVDPEVAEVEAEEVVPADEPVVESVETTEDSIELHFADGTTKTFAYKNVSVETPEPEVEEPQPDVKAQLEALRAHMTQSDKSIGLALKTMKDLLATKGGE